MFIILTWNVPTVAGIVGNNATKFFYSTSENLNPQLSTFLMLSIPTSNFRSLKFYFRTPLVCMEPEGVFGVRSHSRRNCMTGCDFAPPALSTDTVVLTEFWGFIELSRNSM